MCNIFDVICCVGTGKTTLAQEICLRWARDGFLSEDFDAVILIPVRITRSRSLKDVMREYCGEEVYKQINSAAGRRCLIILEGLDEISADYLNNDQFFVCLVRESTVLEEATILITCRPHACNNLDAGNLLKVVGFSTDKVEQFINMSFPKDKNAVSEFLLQMSNYPRLKSMCYVPLYLVMIIDIFRFSQNRLPSTLKELYQLLLVMILKRCSISNESNKHTSLTGPVTNAVSKNLVQLLPGIPKEAIGTVYSLCRLSFHGFFDWYVEVQEKDKLGNEKKRWNPKILFTIEDLVHCGMDVTNQFPGFSLLQGTVINDTFVYNFVHLSIQEFLCSIYISLLPAQQQMECFNNLFHYDKLWLFYLDFATPSHRRMLENGMIASYSYS